MILTLILSSLAVCAITVFTVFCSGGSLPLILDIPSLVSVLLIFTVLILLTGYGKDFTMIFSSKKKYAGLDLKQLQKTEKVLDVGSRLLLCGSVIIPLLTIIYLFMNDDMSEAYRVHVGPNLSVVMISVIYMCFLELVLCSLKLKVRKSLVLYMAEPYDTSLLEKDSDFTNRKKGSAVALVKFLTGLVVFVAIIVFTAWLSTGGYSWGQRTSLWRTVIDIPSLVIVIAATLLLLTVSGNLKEFFGAFATVFSDKKISVTKKHLYVSALKNGCSLNIYSGIMGTLIGFMAILCNLEDKSALMINMAVALIPLLYAGILNLVLFLVELRVNKVSQ